MGKPEDFKIPQGEFIFAEKDLPFSAALYGFEVTTDNERKNEAIRKRLAELKTATHYSQIRLEGKCRNPRPKPLPNIVVKKHESPFAAYVDSFLQSLRILVQRVMRFNEIGMSSANPLDWFTYQDVILVQTASMCVDREKNNYTIQNFLLRQGKPELCHSVDEVLDRPICVDAEGKDICVWCALKILRDKFLCHLENHEDYNLSYGDSGRTTDKWTVGDRIILSRLLLPPLLQEHKNLGPVREIIAMMWAAFEAARAIGEREILIRALSGNSTGDKPC